MLFLLFSFGFALDEITFYCLNVSLDEIHDPACGLVSDPCVHVCLALRGLVKSVHVPLVEEMDPLWSRFGSDHVPVAVKLSMPRRAPPLLPPSSASDGGMGHGHVWRHVGNRVGASMASAHPCHPPRHGSVLSSIPSEHARFAPCYRKARAAVAQMKAKYTSSFRPRRLLTKMSLPVLLATVSLACLGGKLRPTDAH